MVSWKQCWTVSPGDRWYEKFFVCVPKWLDQLTSELDFALFRGHGGLAERHLKLPRHSLLAYLLPALFLIFFVLGPTLGWRGWPAVVILAASWAVIHLWARWPRRKFPLLGLELVSIFVVGLVVWFLSPVWKTACGGQPLEIGDRIYRHLLVPLFLPIAILLILSARNARRLIRSAEILGPNEDRLLADLLPHADFFTQAGLPWFSLAKLVRAFLNVPVRYPLQLILPPAAGILLLPFPAEPKGWGALFLLANWLLLTFASLHARLTNLVNLGRRLLFVGGQLVISLLVVVLAVGRILGFSYVKTVVESSSWPILLAFLLSAYVSFWFYEYWLNDVLCQRLVALLGGSEGKLIYDLRPDHPRYDTSPVEPEGRVVQVHGGARLVAIGKRKDGTGEEFRIFDKPAFFGTLLELAGRDKETAPQHLEKAAEALRRLTQARNSYFATANFCLLAAAALTALWIFRLEPQLPVSIVPTGDERCAAAAPFEPFDLQEAIWPSEEGEAPDRLVLLAASGGGSRAALYTQSVLHGLSRLEALDDLVLASGVSGGGAALAYFAARRDQFSAANAAWREFTCDFSYPFIWDVLKGSAEWRVVAGERLGRLLQESLERRFFQGPCGGKREGDRCLGQLADLGLILNTTLAGSLDLGDGCSDCGDSEFAHLASRRFWRKRTRGWDAGGRLILTNLRAFETWPEGEPPSLLELPYEVIDDPLVRLSEAAALTANFPPVFSNAALDVERRQRYWVTDGGATDNRGMISLLLALRTALHGRWPEAAVGAPAKAQAAAGAAAPQPTATKPELPILHIVMADATAGSTTYTQDRGLGGKFGATGKVANQLIAELLADVGRAYERVGGRVVFHDLSMPAFLRIDGGLGTHWMLPRSIKMKAPRDDDSDMTLDTFAARAVIGGLHAHEDGLDLDLCPGEKVTWLTRANRWMWVHLARQETREERLARIDQWLAESEHRRSWNCLCRELTGEDCLPEAAPAAESGSGETALPPFDCRGSASEPPPA